MFRHILTFIIIFMSFQAIAQQEIKLDEIKKHIGDSVKITAKVFGGKFIENAKGTPTFLNVGGNYPDAPLTLVIWGEVRKQFKAAPEDAFNQQTVLIYGKITQYKNKPEIFIYNPNQIKEEEASQ